MKKFRAWDKNKKAWIEGFTDQLFLNQDGKIMWWSFAKGFEDVSERIDIVFFTGLLDENGKEVYEGDVVQTYASGLDCGIAVIKFLDGKYCQAHPDDENSMDCVWYYNFKVVGNMYENPEFLNPNFWRDK